MFGKRGPVYLVQSLDNPFRTMLRDLIEHTEVNRNYQKSDLLQVLRILKNYQFFREPQLELFKGRPSSRTQ